MLSHGVPLSAPNEQVYHSPRRLIKPRPCYDHLSNERSTLEGRFRIRQAITC